MRSDDIRAQTLQGIQFASAGLCDCEECRDDWDDWKVREMEVDILPRCAFCAVEMSVKADTMPTNSGHCRECGMLAGSDGTPTEAAIRYGWKARPDLTYTDESDAEAAAQADFADAVRAGWPCDEGHFSRHPCGVCNSPLAGTRYTWHWVDPTSKKLHHESDACTDCVEYLASRCLT